MSTNLHKDRAHYKCTGTASPILTKSSLVLQTLMSIYPTAIAALEFQLFFFFLFAAKQ